MMSLSSAPKISLIYYKSLLDLAVIRFFSDFNNEFIRDSSGKYVLSRSFSKTSLLKMFDSYFKEQLKAHVMPYDMRSPTYCFVIGACNPIDNILYKIKSDSYFPNKLKKFIESNPDIKYILKEDDIDIDITEFNDVFISVFNLYFKDPKRVIKVLGKEYKNIFFVLNNMMDCYSLFKTMKFLYGKTNCINIWKEDKSFKNIMSPVTSVNELIVKYVNEKKKLNSSYEFRQQVIEVKQYCDKCMSSICE